MRPHLLPPLLLSLLLLSTAPGCGDDASDCSFASGRPCPAGAVCFGDPGDECNYYRCEASGLLGTAIACGGGPGDVDPVEGGPFDCDPAHLDPALRGTPPPGPCPLGSLHAIVDGGWGACVLAAQCEPLACDPAFDGAGCATGQTCDAATGTCQAPARACEADAPAACDLVVTDAAACPSLEELCDGVCGAAHECCYCGDDGAWQILFTDCPPCPAG